MRSREYTGDYGRSAARTLNPASDVTYGGYQPNDTFTIGCTEETP
jgi:hypothetical protein